MKSDDRRIRKTRKVLQEALAALMMEKELHKITVKELTEKADVHRGTFYAHYQDVYALFEQMEDNIVSDLAFTFTVNSTHSYGDIYRTIMEYVFENPAVYRLFLGKHQNKIYKLIEEKYLEIWLEEDGLSSVTEEMRYIAAYHVQGCFAIIHKWLEGNFLYPKEEVLQLLQRIDDNIDRVSE